MPRKSRLKYSHADDGYYHIISRTVLKKFLLKNKEKEFFSSLLQKLSQVYFVQIATFSVMSNHFHVVLKMIPQERISDLDLRIRFDRYYNEGISRQDKKRPFIDEDEEKMCLRARWGNISCFVQDLKQRFSRWYNVLNDGHGHIWSERFKSVLLEHNTALLACMVYVELNSVRAGIVKRPEEYRYSGIHHYLAGGRASSWLDYQSVASVLSQGGSGAAETRKQMLKYYLQHIYAEGSIERAGKAKMSEEEVQQEFSEGFSDVGILSMRRKIRYFSDGIILGSQSFCQEKFSEFKSCFQTKKDRKGRAIIPKRKKSPDSGGILKDIFTIRTYKIK